MYRTAVNKEFQDNVNVNNDQMYILLSFNSVSISMHFPFHFKHQRHKREKKERKMMAILVHDFVPLVNSFLRYDIRWFKT
jgi:hypothetical protein